MVINNNNLNFIKYDINKLQLNDVKSKIIDITNIVNNLQSFTQKKAGNMIILIKHFMIILIFHIFKYTNLHNCLLY